ncbi:DNA-binding FadR family transcriptional regulator [Curtobacterium sp. PhB130]|uniref:FadR/GntR family transcriptional regulator n=1 Tax=unclassified Curtobacterium TaxID=257496 RepID=UPI000F4BA0F4|nr:MULTISPECIES: FadR/GntR family transcriptional regulator [unclassified Curtobacterium]ROP61175.1 DNA-binding FadR family transcriptional regulator [Curtobacterium sp. ZW137]ROS75714.1 DNA-binding FadR family transcriptional regulator [Curtobacterium sp. PhB130]TCK64551.1 DNA-binding FadR family transcriptional regulator [Curtobacterium sp. PhB136]
MASRVVQQPVAQQIVELVRELGLRPGDGMPTELELIERLGVSRNTVREAIRELRAWGIVDIRHGHGTFVASPSLQALAPSLVFRTLVAGPDGLLALRNLARVREMLETSAVVELVGVLSDDDRAHLTDLAEEIGDPKLSADADRRFHRALYSHLDNPLIGQLVDVFWDAYHEAHDQLADVSPYGHDSVEAHRAIIRAVVDGDAGIAQEAMRAHFQGIYARLDASTSKLTTASA